MTVNDFYTMIDGDYEGAVRCFGDDLAVKKWLLKLSADTCFVELQESMSRGDRDGIVKSANTLKGLAMNLGLTRLSESSRRLEEGARGGISMETLSLFHAVEKDYAAVVMAVDRIIG